MRTEFIFYTYLAAAHSSAHSYSTKDFIDELGGGFNVSGIHSYSSASDGNLGDTALSSRSWLSDLTGSFIANLSPCLECLKLSEYKPAVDANVESGRESPADSTLGTLAFKVEDPRSGPFQSNLRIGVRRRNVISGTNVEVLQEPSPCAFTGERTSFTPVEQYIEVSLPSGSDSNRKLKLGKDSDSLSTLSQGVAGHNIPGENSTNEDVSEPEFELYAAPKTTTDLSLNNGSGRSDADDAEWHDLGATHDGQDVNAHHTEQYGFVVVPRP